MYHYLCIKRILQTKKNINTGERFSPQTTYNLVLQLTDGLH